MPRSVLIDVPPQATADLAGRAVDLAAAAFRDKELAKLSVPLGLLSGLFAGWAYNRWSDFRLPSYLAFFGGRRFVPIVCGFAGLALGLLFGVAWPAVEHGMDVTSQAVLGSESLGLFAYGVLNRVLIVTGLHHIINNIAWFLLGDYNGVTGDLKRFFAGDPSAGAFMSGFFPVMMFGLPGACLAMYRTAAPEKRKAVGGMLFSMALTSFLTGVTEPIEFSFMFLAPLLYAIHAVLTGIAMALMHALGVHLGFGFSAGLFDYVLNFSLSTRPWMLLPVGLGYFGLYYGLFRYFIVRFDLKTLGRETDEAARATRRSRRIGARLCVDPGAGVCRQPAFGGSLHHAVAPGGRGCRAHRRARAEGAGLARRAQAGRWRRAGGGRPHRRPAGLGDSRGIAPSAARYVARRPRSVHLAPPPSTAPPDPGVMARVLQALGGRDNIADLQHRGSRLCIAVRDPAAVDESALTNAVRVRARNRASLAGQHSPGDRSRGRYLVRRNEAFLRRGEIPAGARLRGVLQAANRGPDSRNRRAGRGFHACRIAKMPRGMTHRTFKRIRALLNSRPPEIGRAR